MKRRNVYIASVIGEILEWYDFSLYSFLSPVFAILFFPQAHFLAGILGVFGIFAAGFISRPFGGLIFGWIGDRYGRKSAFCFSLLLMAAATFFIGCLPTFQQVGFLAPLLLLVLRLLQGFSCSGEFSISMIFLTEHAKKDNYYFSGSLAWMGTMIGALLASLVIIMISAQHDFLMRWGFRIPFFLGALIGIAGVYFRRKVAETPVYLALRQTQKTRYDRWRFLKNHKRVMLKIFSLNAPLAALSYVGVAFLPTFLAKFVGMDLHNAFLVNTVLILSLIILIPLSGCLADKIGGQKLYKGSILALMFLSLPAYALFSYGDSWLAYGFAIFMIAIPGAILKAVTPGMSIQLSPVEDRSVTFSFSYNVAYSIIGGMAPLLMSYGIGVTGCLLLPAAYVIVFSLFSLLCF